MSKVACDLYVNVSETRVLFAKVFESWTVLLVNVERSLLDDGYDTTDLVPAGFDLVDRTRLRDVLGKQF